jgi:hypothetical protein
VEEKLGENERKNGESHFASRFSKRDRMKNLGKDVQSHLHLEGVFLLMETVRSSQGIASIAKGRR